MIRRLWRLVALIPVLTMLWGFASGIGIISALNSGNGWHVPSLDIPFVDKYLAGDLDGAADAAKQQAKDAAGKITGSKQAGPISDPYLSKQAYQSALSTLATLTVKGKAPMTGYSRDQFGPAWTDDNNDQWGHNGCDTRDDILKRDLTSVTYKAGTDGCVVATGVFHDPYTDTVIDFVRGPQSALIQIDHTVALADAWVTGASTWSASKRQDYANDPTVLLASQGSANEAKGDGDAATWLPPNKSFRCAYVARQIAVKAKYRLWVTPAEHDVMKSLLTGCLG